MFRDRLACGINDAQIQRQLLAENSFTIAKTSGVQG